MATKKQIYEALLDNYGVEIADAFLYSIYDIRNQADLKKLQDAIEAGNLQDTFAALNIEPAAFDPFAESIRTAFNDVGSIEAASMPITIRFSVRNPRAEDWLAQESGTLISGIISDQRVAVRDALVAGMSRGQNPRDTALDIVGRIGPSGNREGGILGLTAQQNAYVWTAYNELISGDSSFMGNYLDRTLRDRRFDSMVEKAIAAGEPLSANDAMTLVGRYSDSMLKYRADTIGRTESLTALHAAKQEAYDQLVENSNNDVQRQDVMKTWESAGDNRVRDSHAALDGQTIGMDELFVSPLTGERMLYPGDTDNGAGPEEVINCRCDVSYDVDWIGVAGREAGLVENQLPEGAALPEPESVPEVAAETQAPEQIPVEEQVPVEMKYFKEQFSFGAERDQEIANTINEAHDQFERAGLTIADDVAIQQLKNKVDELGHSYLLRAPGKPPPQSVQGVVDGSALLDNFAEQYPKLKVMLDAVDPKMFLTTYTKSFSVPMATINVSGLDNTYVLLNTNFDLGGEQVNPKYAMSIKLAGVSSTHDQFQWAFIHEMGHVLDDATGHTLSQSLAEWIRAKTEYQITPQETKMWFNDNVSGYAYKDAGEAWAESFLNIVSGAPAHPLIQEFWDDLMTNNSQKILEAMHNDPNYQK